MWTGGEITAEKLCVLSGMGECDVLCSRFFQSVIFLFKLILFYISMLNTKWFVAIVLFLRYCWFYFYSVSIIVSFFGLNLCLAVVEQAYEQERHPSENPEDKVIENVLNSYHICFFIENNISFCFCFHSIDSAILFSKILSQNLLYLIF